MGRSGGKSRKAAELKKDIGTKEPKEWRKRGRSLIVSFDYGLQN